jgi:hypothetical protein
MLDKNTLVKVTNRDNGSVGYSIPDLGNLQRRFEAGETKEVTMEELRKLSYTIGGMVILKEYLLIHNNEAVEELLGQVEPEYYYEESDVKDLLEKGSLDALKDCLDFAPEGTIELVKKVAVETELNDIKKREAIQSSTGFNISSAIEVNKETSEERPEEVKVRRTAATTVAEPTTTGRRTAAPTASKYKIVNSK